MEKKLPNIFVNKINKEMNNNEKICITKKTNSIEENVIKKEINNIKVNSKDIENKLKEIMKNKKTKYKIPVKITTEEEVINKYIVGKNNNYIITIENELIPISKIKNIELKNE